MTSDAGDGRWPDIKEIVQIALPLYLSMIAVSLSALVNTASLGRFATASLAGFAVTVAVYFPAMAAVSGAVRGVMPFVAAANGPAQCRRGGTYLQQPQTLSVGGPFDVDFPAHGLAQGPRHRRHLGEQRRGAP